MLISFLFLFVRVIEYRAARRRLQLPLQQFVLFCDNYVKVTKVSYAYNPAIVYWRRHAGHALQTRAIGDDLPYEQPLPQGRPSSVARSQQAK